MTVIYNMSIDRADKPWIGDRRLTESSGMQWRMNAGLDFIAEKAIKIDRASERSSMKSTRDASSLLAQRWLSDWKGALSLRWATFRRAEVRR